MAQVMSKAKSAPEERKSSSGAATGTVKGQAAADSEPPVAKGKTAAKSATSARRAASTKSSTATKATVKRAAKPSAAKAAGSAANGAGAAPAGLSRTQARLLRKMQDERAKLVHQAAELEAEQRALAADPEAAEMSSDLESGDCVASREREVDLRVSAHVGEMIEQIDRATERLHTGTYGSCARCGAKIPAARLEALPYAELCVSCQQQHERLYH